ncbi:polysaccharide deacetylase family protein [Sulfitobacter guttiformis]|uniref:Polysaccharide deacetylase n=1 Tax=Sulfitobacter guttiformis TaxID=74349 RepID=A0A420DTZ7_9RHOB|nr:polysaccharide deacetylase [Sulfitobacter guttiformis]KIN71176.1 Polysaccharide deacetylase-like protein [Sulfitobacter guttiformis KCTC 32187]RKE97648.1 hypothetical protein C8N30_2267 [Sulfitobacter guttiformis]
MKIDWSPLTAELALCRRAGLPVPLWWRDDDAVAATAALDLLSDLAATTGVNVHVAVIPERIAPSLAPAFASRPALVPVIHGWRHISHAPEGAKNAEFGHQREGAFAELKLAYKRLDHEFGARLVPLFVPPWNRMAAEFHPALVSAKYCGLSTFGPRPTVTLVKGLVQINTHIDPIFWRGHRGLVDPEVLVAEITATLRDRRTGQTDSTEPLGLLTHHLVHSAEVWDFTADVLRVLLDAGAVPADIGALVQTGRNPSI